jgi:hypothetical protein
VLGRLDRSFVTHSVKELSCFLLGWVAPTLLMLVQSLL